MSTFNSAVVSCPACRHDQAILSVESANVQRLPEYRERVLAGTFMRFVCDACRAPFIVERELLYTDLERQLFVGVFPESERPRAASLAKLIEQVYQQTFVDETPPVVRANLGELHRRVAFGYEELREKVVCFEAGLDDRLIEAIKLMILDGDPDLARRGVRRLSLQQVAGGALWFARIGPDGVAKPGLARVMYSVYEGVEAERERLPVLLGPLFEGPYVSMERCRPAAFAGG